MSVPTKIRLSMEGEQKKKWKKHFKIPNSGSEKEILCKTPFFF